jgi:hypothetical protein
MIDRRADLPLAAFFFDGHVLIDFPIEALAFLVTFDESVVLSKIMAHT